MKIIFVLILFAFTAYADDDKKGLEPIEEVFEPAGFFDPKIYAKVAVVQWAGNEATPLGVTVVEAEKFKQTNRDVLARYIAEAAAKGAKWVITPEFATVGYPDIPELPNEEDNFQNREQIAPYVESVKGPSFAFFSKIAAEKKVHLHVGIAERDSKTDRYYNTVIVIGADGKLITSYRKMHLFQVEVNFLSPGEKPVIFQSELGPVGLAICSDIYSSEPMDYYRQKKVAAVALSTSWANWNTGMEHFQEGARWVNGYVLAANQNYFPDSGIINPDGSKQSHIRQTTGIAYGYLPYR